MNREKNKYIGSNFDDFLKEEGILEEIEEVVVERIFFFQVDRIWNPQSPSTLPTFEN